jgi:hypothetical protein
VPTIVLGRPYCLRIGGALSPEMSYYLLIKPEIKRWVGEESQEMFEVSESVPTIVLGRPYCELKYHEIWASRESTAEDCSCARAVICLAMQSLWTI